LKTEGRVNYHGVTDQETLDAFYKLSSAEGIIPALESSHAVAWAMKHGQENPGSTLLINLSGRGDKDIDYVTEHFGFGENA
jgi:tryptophan synthase beta chain